MEQKLGNKLLIKILTDELNRLEEMELKQANDELADVILTIIEQFSRNSKEVFATFYQKLVSTQKDNNNV